MANPYFNAAYYLETNKDVYAAGYTLETAEQHYLEYGAQEAYLAEPDSEATGPQVGDTGYLRKPAPWFDIQYYIDSNPDLIANGVTIATAFQHFVDYGISEGRSPSEYVNLDAAALSAYAAGNPDLMEAFGIEDADDLNEEQETALAQHFYEYGYMENRPDLPTIIDNQFTVDEDDLVGTAYDDTFVAAVADSLQTGDKVDGRGGSNVVEIAGGAIAAPDAGEDAVKLDTTNIQKIINSDIRFDGQADKTLDLEDARGLKELETDFSGVAAYTADGVGTNGNGYANYVEAAAATVFGISNAAAQAEEGKGKVGINVDFADPKVDTLNLVLEGNAEDSYYAGIMGTASEESAGLKNVNIDVVEGNSGTIALNNSVQNITITGDGDLALQNRDYSKLVNFDASEATGDIALGGEDRDLTDGSAQLNLGQNFILKTGSGDDIIDLSTVTTTGNVNAGDGDDTIIVNLDSSEVAVWTLTGGEGADTFTISGSNWTQDGDDGGDTSSGAIITDFNSEEDTLELGFGDVATTLVAADIVNRVVINSQDVDEAIGKLIGEETAFADANVAVFEFGEATYAVYQAADVGVDGAPYGVIQLTGTDLGLNANNIDGFDVASL